MLLGGEVRGFRTMFASRLSDKQVNLSQWVGILCILRPMATLFKGSQGFPNRVTLVVFV